MKDGWSSRCYHVFFFLDERFVEEVDALSGVAGRESTFSAFCTSSIPRFWQKKNWHQPERAQWGDGVTATNLALGNGFGFLFYRLHLFLLLNHTEQGGAPPL